MAENRVFKKSELLAMFEEMDFANAAKWSDAMLKSKVEDLGDYEKEKDAKLPISKAGLELFNELKALVDDDEEFEIDDDVPKAKGPEAKTKKEKTVTTATKTKKTPAAKTTKTESNGVEKDQFGARLGTLTAKANAALTNKWKTMKEIVEDAGLNGTVYNHMNKLVELGFAEKSEEGYRLKGGTAAPAPKKKAAASKK